MTTTNDPNAFAGAAEKTGRCSSNSAMEQIIFKLKEHYTSLRQISTVGTGSVCGNRLRQSPVAIARGKGKSTMVFVIR